MNLFDNGKAIYMLEGVFMKVLWIDPVNSDPQFLNALSLALASENNDVTVCSNRRKHYDVPEEISWTTFSVREVSQTFDGKPFFQEIKTYASSIFAFPYFYFWIRAIRLARKMKVKNIIFSSSLVFPYIDSLGLSILKSAGIASLLISHKPYPNFFRDTHKKNASKYIFFYSSVTKIMVMTNYSKALLKKEFNIDDKRFISFPHPHFNNLLSKNLPLTGLKNSFSDWAGDSPVIAFISTPYERGLELFTESLFYLKNILPNAKLLIISTLYDIARQKNIEYSSEKAGFGNSAWFHWNPYSYSELLAYLHAVSVIAVPYPHSTQSGVIPMANGLGIPVVSTTAGGLPEMVIAGKTGELVPYGDPEAFACAVAKVASPDANKIYKKNVSELFESLFSPKKAAKVICESLISTKI
ncbi:MAG: glycosyltransferase family 4 protein [Candidatus Riflebacteria bacterium]|nr:glycosyltransferase family 4 protein [Candidatus Riflebacteria bacterium]